MCANSELPPGGGRAAGAPCSQTPPVPAPRLAWGRAPGMRLSRGHHGATAARGSSGGARGSPQPGVPMGTVPGDGLELPQVPRRIGSVRPVGLQNGPWLFYWFGYGVGVWLCLSPNGGGCGNPGGLHPQRELIWCLRSGFCLLLPLARVQPHAHACRAAVDTAPAPGCAPTALQARLCDPLQHLGLTGGQEPGCWGGVQP